jgi:dTDP-4-amino-4,6-dideoxygalactose transaminase
MITHDTPIPVVNLRPQIEQTREQWTLRLEEMFARQQFILGDQERAFEGEFAAAMGAQYAIGCGNGTDAIGLCLREAGVTNERQEVITSALTAPFSGIGILSAGASPRFADVNPDTLQIDVEDAGNRITKRTAALLPVHLYGQPCALQRFVKLARDRKLVLVQDAAQAHGATVDDKPLAAFSPYVAYSFYPTKNLGALGDGGAVVTNRKGAAARLRILRDGGRKGGQVTYLPGVNSRLDEMHACYLRAFLERLADWNNDRRRTARLYDNGLAGCGGVTLVKRGPESVCHLYVIRARKRDALRQHLAARGIGTGIHYPVPLHLHPTYRVAGLRKGDLPHAEKACRELVSLPLWPYLEESAALRVIDEVRKFYGAGA